MIGLLDLSKCQADGCMWSMDLDGLTHCMRCGVQRETPPDLLGADAVMQNWESWAADIWAAVQDRSAETGLSHVEIACRHHMALMLAGASPFVLRIWGEFVAHLTGHLPPGQAKRRWTRITR